jgi:hypothetical protein
MDEIELENIYFSIMTAYLLDDIQSIISLLITCNDLQIKEYIEDILNNYI